MQAGKSRRMFTSTMKATAVALAMTAAAQAQAAGTHPVTGETLSDNQTFTYRLLDQFPTLDPQLNEETSGFHVIRDLFEGLLSQDANGDLTPGGGHALCGVRRQYHLHLHAAQGRQVVEWRSGDRA